MIDKIKNKFKGAFSSVLKSREVVAKGSILWLLGLIIDALVLVCMSAKNAIQGFIANINKKSDGKREEE